MMVKRDPLFVGFVLLFSLLVAGCLHTEILMTFSPTPIVLSPDDTTINGQLTLRLIGYGIINVEAVVFSFLTEGGETIIPPFKIELNSSLPISATEQSVPITLPFGYYEAKATGLERIRVQVTGQRPSVLDIPVKLVGANELWK